MKTFAFVLMISSLSCLDGYSQNRISAWDAEKITSVQVEYRTSGNEIKVATFNARSEIDRILTFLGAVEFKDFAGSGIDTQAERDKWKYRILFQGQSAQVYLFEKFAFIGRSSFLIDPKVTEDFGRLIEK